MPTAPPRFGRQLAPTLSTFAQDKRLRGRRGVQQRRRRLDAEPLCRICAGAGRTTIATRVDHIKPLALGGLDLDANCRSLCVPCHTAVTREQFRGC
jgi:5-methylcytosine-specific restriction protein A